MVAVATRAPLQWVRIALISAVTTLFALGLVMIFNTSSAEVLDQHLQQSTHHALVRQLLYAACGLTVATFLWLVGHVRLLRLSGRLLVVGTFLLILPLLPGIGVEANGAKRWIGIAGFTLQPSEFVRQIIPLFVIHQLVTGDPEGKRGISFRTLLRVIAAIAPPIVLVALEPNNATVAIIMVSVIAVLFLLQVAARYWALPMLGAILVASVAAYNMPYVAARLRVYVHPESDLLGRGHQPHQAKIAAGSGGVFGKGPGKSVQKLSYLPEAQNDYIAAIFAEEFGFVGMFSLVVLYTVFFYCGFAMALLAPDRGGAFLAASLTFLIGFQAFLNLGVVSGLLPSTGLNLPFFSQGGTSLIANSAAVGVILQIGSVGRQVETVYGKKSDRAIVQGAAGENRERAWRGVS